MTFICVCYQLHEKNMLQLKLFNKGKDYFFLQNFFKFFLLTIFGRLFSVGSPQLAVHSLQSANLKHNLSSCQNPDSLLSTVNCQLSTFFNLTFLLSVPFPKITYIPRRNSYHSENPVTGKSVLSCRD